MLGCSHEWGSTCSATIMCWNCGIDIEDYVKKQAEEIKRLRGALKFYANREIYNEVHPRMLECMYDARADRGKKAREALDAK